VTSRLGTRGGFRTKSVNPGSTTLSKRLAGAVEIVQVEKVSPNRVRVTLVGYAY
jgi:hypothetical protein